MAFVIKFLSLLIIGLIIIIIFFSVISSSGTGITIRYIISIIISKTDIIEINFLYDPIELLKVYFNT